jgi:hypothetical protein
MGTKNFWTCDLDLGVCLIENCNLGYIFWLAVSLLGKALTFHMTVPCNKIFSWIPKNWPCGLDLGVDVLIKFCDIFLIVHVCTRTLIFLMGVSSDKAFLWVPTDLVTFTLVVDLHIENFNQTHIFWIVCTRTLTFHMSVCKNCDNSFQWVPTGLTLWPWPLCLTWYLLKTLTVNWLYLLNGNCIKSFDMNHTSVPRDN